MLSHVSWMSVWVGSNAGGASYCVCVQLLACRWGEGGPGMENLRQKG